MGSDTEPCIFLVHNNNLVRWVGLGVFLGILAGGLVKEEAAEVTDLVKGLVVEEGEPLPSL